MTMAILSMDLLAMAIWQPATVQSHKRFQSPSRLQAECSVHLKQNLSPLTHIQVMSSMVHHLQPTSRQSLKALTNLSSLTAVHLQSQHLSWKLAVNTHSLQRASQENNSHISATKVKTFTQNLISAQKRVENKPFTCLSTSQQWLQTSIDLQSTVNILLILSGTTFQMSTTSWQSTSKKREHPTTQWSPIGQQSSTTAMQHTPRKLTTSSRVAHSTQR